MIKIKNIEADRNGGGVIVHNGKEYHLWGYSEACKYHKGCLLGGWSNTANVILHLRRPVNPEDDPIPNPLQYDYIVLWKCGHGSWERERFNFNINNLFFED